MKLDGWQIHAQKGHVPDYQGIDTGTIELTDKPFD